MMREARSRMPVPSTAIFSRDDGNCVWKSWRERPARASENIEAHGSRCDLGATPPYSIALPTDRRGQKATGRTSWRRAAHRGFTPI